MIRTLIVALVLIPLSFAAAQTPDDPKRLVEQIAADFITDASQSWTDYRVCDLRSKKDDKRAFLARSFEKDAFAGNVGVTWKELRVNEEGVATSLHLGIVAVSFRDPKEAARVHGHLTGTEPRYLKGTKILTQYKALVRDNTVLLFYSETYSHEALRRFFASAALHP